MISLHQKIGKILEVNDTINFEGMEAISDIKEYDATKTVRSQMLIF